MISKNGKKKFSGFGYKLRAKIFRKIIAKLTNRYADLERRGEIWVVTWGVEIL